MLETTPSARIVVISFVCDIIIAGICVYRNVIADIVNRIVVCSAKNLNIRASVISIPSAVAKFIVTCAAAYCDIIGFFIPNIIIASLATYRGVRAAVINGVVVLAAGNDRLLPLLSM